MTLDKLARGDIAAISGFDSSSQNEKMVAKLREIGFAEGDEVELLHRGPLGGSPLSFRLNRTIVALRKREAALIAVRVTASADAA